MFEAAIDGDVVEMYPGGLEQRTGDIEAGFTTVSRRVARRCDGHGLGARSDLAAMPDEAWTGHGITIRGRITMSDLLFIRWRETTVHHADLGLDFSVVGLGSRVRPAELARLTPLWASRKPMGLTELPPEALRAGDHHRVAWLLGRAEIEGLGPAGINP